MAGQMVHVEIPAGDTEKAQGFWGGLFGWQFQAFEGSPTPYLMTRFSENQGGAIYQPESGQRGGPRVYFDVEDINAANSKVNDLGGQAGEALPVPGMGWFSINKDPEGNEFGLWQNDESAPPPTA
jgi:uncharacterized protein